MALFNTLKQILTPYANKINLHTEEIDGLKEDVIVNNIAIPFIDNTKTVLGITFTPQGNKIHAVGTATGNVNFYLKQDVTFDISVKSVLISGCPLGGSPTTYAIRVGKYRSGGSGTSGWNAVLSDYGFGNILNVVPDSKYVFVCTVFSGATVDIYFDPKVFCNIDKSIPTIRKTLYDHDDFVFIKPEGDSKYHGECIILNGDKKGLFDFGYDANCNTLIAELQGLNISSIDYVVISHYHSDHITTDFATAIDTLITAGIDFSDCVFFLPHYGIDWTGFSGQTDNKESVEVAVINKLDTLGFRHVHPENNQIFVLSDNLSFRFLNIGNYENYYSYTLGMNQQDLGYTNYNSFSMVTDVNSHGNHILISADATPIALDNISDYLYNCDLYKIEHHGLNKKSSYKWLNKLNPKYCVITSYSDDYSDDFTLSRDTPRSLAVNSAIFSTLDGKVVAKSQRGCLSCSGNNIDRNYRKSAILSVSDTVINAVLKAHNDDATSIVSTSSYITTTGEYYVLNGICYFSVLIFFEKSVNTGINNVFGLPKPDSNDINNEYSLLDELGNSTQMKLYYNPTNNNWRLNGAQSVGHYLLAYGAYKVETI